MLYRKENVHGGDVYRDPIELDYSVNVNPLGTPQTVIRAIQESAPQIGCYPDPFCTELVKAIADYEQVPADMVLCGNGAAELIYAFCQAQKPEKAVVTAPSFAEYDLALQGMNSQVRRYFLRRDCGFALEEGFLSFLTKEHPAAAFLCNPNNPDGREILGELMQKILEQSRKLGIRLLIDECFADLSDHQFTVRNCLREYPNVFLLKAFTKNYAMAGIRLGYGLCSDPEFLARMSETAQPWNISLPAQAAGIAAVRERDIILRAREIISVQRPWLSRKLRELGFLVCPSEANFILFQGPAGVNLETELKQKGIAIRNCGNYPGLEEGWYRIAVKLEDENRRLIHALQELLT